MKPLFFFFFFFCWGGLYGIWFLQIQLLLHCLLLPLSFFFNTKSVIYRHCTFPKCFFNFAFLVINGSYRPLLIFQLPQHRACDTNYWPSRYIESWIVTLCELAFLIKSNFILSIWQSLPFSSRSSRLQMYR